MSDSFLSFRKEAAFVQSAVCDFFIRFLRFCIKMQFVSSLPAFVCTFNSALFRFNLFSHANLAAEKCSTSSELADFFKSSS